MRQFFSDNGQIMMWSINDGVPLPPFFRLLLCLLILVAFIGLAVFFRIRGVPFGSAIRRAGLATFFGAGLIYAFAGLALWGRWVAQDYRAFAGLTSGQKVMKVDERIATFAAQTRTVVRSENYTMCAPPGYFELLTQYYLLPARRRDDAAFLVVIADPEVKYDSTSKVFERKGVRLENVDLCVAPYPYACVLKKEVSRPK